MDAPIRKLALVLGIAAFLGGFLPAGRAHAWGWGIGASVGRGPFRLNADSRGNVGAGYAGPHGVSLGVSTGGAYGSATTPYGGTVGASTDGQVFGSYGREVPGGAVDGTISNDGLDANGTFIDPVTGELR